MSVQIGDQYIGIDGGTILTVVKVLIAEDANEDLVEYAVLDNSEGRAIPSYKLKQLCVKVVQSESNPGPFVAVKAAYPGATWIAKDEDDVVHVFFEEPRLRGSGVWMGAWNYLSREGFPEVYAYFADIPFDESSTQL